MSVGPKIDLRLGASEPPLLRKTYYPHPLQYCGSPPPAVNAVSIRGICGGRAGTRRARRVSRGGPTVVGGHDGRPCLYPSEVSPAQETPILPDLWTQVSGSVGYRWGRPVDVGPFPVVPGVGSD